MPFWWDKYQLTGSHWGQGAAVASGKTDHADRGVLTVSDRMSLWLVMLVYVGEGSALLGNMPVSCPEVAAAHFRWNHCNNGFHALSSLVTETQSCQPPNTTGSRIWDFSDWAASMFISVEQHHPHQNHWFPLNQCSTGGENEVQGN